MGIFCRLIFFEIIVLFFLQDNDDAIEEGEGADPGGDDESSEGTCDLSVAKWGRPAHPT